MRDKIIAILSEARSISTENISNDTTVGEICENEFDVVDIILALEEEFNIEFSDDEPFVLFARTVGELISAIESKVQE